MMIESRRPSMRLYLFPALVWAAALLGCERAAGALKPSDAWHRLLINGQPAGFTRQIDEELKGGNFSRRTIQELVVQRDGDAVRMTMEQTVEETPAGVIVRFRMLQRLAEADQVIEGVVGGESMEVTTTGLGNARHSTVPHERRALGPCRLDQVFREKLRRPGDSHTAITFFPEKLACGSVTATLGEEENVELPGGARRLSRRTTRTDILPGWDLVEWIDDRGEVWKSATKMLGMSIETVRSSAADILKEKYASPPEIFYASSVRPERPPREPLGPDEVVYRFSLREGDFRSRGIEAMFRGTGQTVLREESPSRRVVRIQRVLPGRRVSRPVPAAKELADCLAPNAFIQSDDALVQKLAAEAVRGEGDAFEAAKRIESWVRDHVKFNNLKTPFASAKEVAVKLEGDCTEHGVLLAAMARASGIPSRVVSGLVYYRGTFVGHLWTEVYIDRWVPLDGTRAQGVVAPDHIALTASPLANSSAADLFFDLAQVIGNLKIEVLEDWGA